ncbi:MAG TPA: AarF/UbiB family protein [Opitutaceae bacterium]|nr:AarF/UbiB family protein [Opitutaceae bacterium]
MNLSPAHLRRYRQIAMLFWKYGRSDLMKQMAVDDAFQTSEIEAQGAVPPQAEQLADDLEAMGPTYVKLGQILAGRPDLLPEPYLKALSRLQDQVKPFPYEEVEKTILSELGVRVSKAFSRFDPEPLAAASLAQVHQAALREGTPVVVKVQRPEIRPQIAEDFEVLAEIADFLEERTDFGRRQRLRSVVAEFRAALQQELNFELEAQNLVAIGKNLAQFPLIRVPQPVPDYCTRSVLTMEHVGGRKITTMSPLARLELNGGKLADEILHAYLKQVLVDGLFHADPHPGNVFVTDDGKIALLDFGMVGHITPAMQDHLLKILLAIVDGKGDAAAEVIEHISEKTEAFNSHGFRGRLGQVVAVRRNQGLEQINVGRTLLEITRQAQEHGLFVPSELVLLAKTMLQLDEIGRILDPEFDVNGSLRRHAGEMASKRMGQQTTKGGLMTSLLEMKDFTTHLPARLNRIMDSVANAELEVKIRATDAKTVVEGIEKVANRITHGLLLAALIVGGALMMRVDTTWRIFGYPGFAMLCFLAAAGGALLLVVKIAAQDRRRKRNARQ